MHIAETPRVNEEISLDNVPHIMPQRWDWNSNGSRSGPRLSSSSHILMFAVVSLKHFVNGLFCLAISLKGLVFGQGIRGMGHEA